MRLSLTSPPGIFGTKVHLHFANEDVAWDPSLVRCIRLDFRGVADVPRYVATHCYNAYMMEDLLRHRLLLIPAEWRDGRTIYFDTTYTVNGDLNFYGMTWLARTRRWETVLCENLPDGPNDYFACKPF